MKKIVILTHYFSPCTLTPSQRITYWAKNLNRMGYYPIVITRHWSADIKSHDMTKLPFGSEIEIQKKENYEVIYVPFRPGLLDWSYLKFGENSLRPIFLFAKILDVMLVPFTLRHTSYWNYQKFIIPFFKDNPDLDKLVISGEPFYLFKIGYLLSRKFEINWFADYRDDWSTSTVEVRKSSGFLRKLIFQFESIFEKRWVKTARGISSVSELYTSRIADFIDVPGVTIENGFEESLLELKPLPLFSEFTIIYSGTLYPSQNISILLGLLVKLYQDGISFKFIFLGTGFDSKERNRIISLVPDSIKSFVEITDRLPREQALITLQKAHVLLGIAHEDLKGIPSSKIYEYIALGKPVLLCPTDNDVMEKILLDSGLGYFSSNVEEAFKELVKIKELYGKPDELEKIVVESKDNILKYNRFEQLKKLLPILDD